jgi:CBS domain-containing protein
MRIDSLSPVTSGRLRTIEADEPVRSVAMTLSGGDTGLVVVCGDRGQATGVISKSDLIRHLVREGSAAAAAAELMTRTFVSCRPGDDIRAVWQEMTARRLQNVPVLGAGSRPLGILDIRDAMRVILEAEQLEERALANYIVGIGYR